MFCLNIGLETSFVLSVEIPLTSSVKHNMWLLIYLSYIKSDVCGSFLPAASAFPTTF